MIAEFRSNDVSSAAIGAGQRNAMNSAHFISARISHSSLVPSPPFSFLLFSLPPPFSFFLLPLFRHGHVRPRARARAQDCRTTIKVIYNGEKQTRAPASSAIDRS
jgi:hypothetical protein